MAASSCRSRVPGGAYELIRFSFTCFRIARRQTLSGTDKLTGFLRPLTISDAGKTDSILFNNLLENAVRYTPTGGSVDISIRREGAGAVIEVADTGPGVREKDLPHLLERFFRAAGPETEGSGLGLAIVNAIARRHGFEVTIMNCTGGGLAVRVRCPAKVV